MSPGYRIHVHNTSRVTVDTTVRQSVPSGASLTSASDGGQSSGREVIWRLFIPAGATTTVSSSFDMTGPQGPVTAPACAYAPNAYMPYDCGSGAWTAPPPPPRAPGPPWWQQRPNQIAAAAAVVLLPAIVLPWRRLRRRRRLRAQARAEAVRAAYRAADPRRPLIRLRPARRRLTPPVWVVVPAAMMAIAGLVAAALWLAITRLDAMDRKSRQPVSAWAGEPVVGEIGAGLREKSFEFTVYRMVCQPPMNRGPRPCLATVGLHNASGTSQLWYGSMQRAYFPNGTWVSVDEAATRAANGGKDVFADPVPAGSRLLVPLQFTVPDDTDPNRLELRSGVFPAGVTINVP